MLLDNVTGAGCSNPRRLQEGERLQDGGSVEMLLVHGCWSALDQGQWKHTIYVRSHGRRQEPGSGANGMAVRATKDCKIPESIGVGVGGRVRSFGAGAANLGSQLGLYAFGQGRLGALLLFPRGKLPTQSRSLGIAMEKATLVINWPNPITISGERCR